ncbi:MAG: ice-binding family protein, partial [Saprospiraceae bacterium]|nr:ice-binding family protein [Saprospiraceae bacterium]
MQKFSLLLLTLFTVLSDPHIGHSQAPDLGVSASFALFTAAGAFNGDPGSSVIGDIGTNVGAFTPPGFHVGNVHVADPVSAQAAADVAIAYADLAGRTCGLVLGTPFGNGQTLAPNVYCIGSAAVLNGNLILDGGGDPGAIFIFQIDGALSTNPGSNITLTNGTNLCNVYWQVNGAFNHNGTTFLGTVIAAGAINLGTGAQLTGRGLSTMGAISTSANIVTLPAACLCALDVTCPDPSGGTFECIADIPAGDVDDVTINSSCGTASVDITETSTGTGCVNSPYVLTRTYTVTDEGGHSTQCVVTYTAIDDTPPTLTCPTGVSVSCTNNVPAPAPGSVSATDNCGGTVTIVFVGDAISNQTCANRYTITRTYRGTDDCGNSATCAQTITVNDITAPTITCPTNVTVSCASSVPPASTASVTASDLCGGTVTIVHVGDVITNQTCANRYTITRTYQATDVCGNSATCAQTITVNDITPPSITCPANVTVSCASSVPPVSIAGVTTSDNCGGVVTVVHVGDVISNQTCANRYTITRTYRATDVCGNSATCAQIITVNDITPPSITCPANVQVVCASDVPAAAPASVIAFDLCGGTVTVVHVGDVISNQVCANRFTITRTYRATDVCGNSATCVQIITVFDNIAPTFVNPPANVTVECFEIPAIPPPPTATDNCAGLVTVVFLGETRTDGICPTLYTLVRTWRATDVCGNSSTVSQTVTVQDTYAPQFIIQPVDVVLECNLETNEDTYQDWLDNHGGASVFDCSEITWSWIYSPLFTMPSDCGGTSQRLIRFIATDECGNSAFWDARFTIIDTTPPTFTILPQNLDVECWMGEEGEAQMLDWLDHFG